MKRIYFLACAAFFSGSLMAQKATLAENDADKTKPGNATTSGIASNSTTGVYDVNSELPGFPVFKNTGDIEKDNATFQAARDKWMQDEKNKALYDQFMKKSGKVDAAENQVKSEQPK